jgi:hypothetical protein
MLRHLRNNLELHLSIYSPREANNLVGRRRLCSVLTDFVMLTKLVRIIKIYVNGTYGKFHVGKRLFDTCPNHNGLKEEMSYGCCFSTLL